MATLTRSSAEGPGRAGCSGRRKGRAGRRPLSGLRLLPDPSLGSAASWAFLEGLGDGIPFASSPPPFSVVAPVRPLWRTRHSCGRRAGQGRAGKCLLCWLKLLFLAP